MTTATDDRAPNRHSAALTGADKAPVEGPASAAPLPEHLEPSTGLLSFYDRLRRRIIVAIERRGSKLGTGTVEALLLVPDIFMMLVRLTLDKSVPRSTRTMVAGALAYFIMPVDFLPEMVVGAGGYIDDVVLALMVLSQAFDEKLEPYAEKYWSGSQPLRVVISDILTAAKGLVSSNVYSRLVSVLDKQGIRVDEPVPEVDASSSS